MKWEQIKLTKADEEWLESRREAIERARDGFLNIFGVPPDLLREPPAEEADGEDEKA